MTCEVVLARRPQGALQASDLRLQAQSLPACGEGEIRLAIRYLSIDPFTRIFLDEQALGGAMQGLPLGSVLPGAAVGEVVESRADGFSPGDMVEGRFGWREAIVTGTDGVRRLDPALGSPRAALGILGLPGTTAYTGMITVAGIQAGETAIISSAAGAVGLTAGQIAKIRGARAVGIAGGPEKCAMVLDHGFDACVDYKAPGFEQALVDACPGGAQVYFDNVGGQVAMAAYAALGRGGRVALCGLLSLYQGEGGEAGDLGRFMRLIMSRGLRIQAYGTVQICLPEALPDLSRWLKDGAIHIPETVVDGLAAAPQAFADMLTGSAQGKLILKLP
ncbi:hypothetical protein FHS51_001230 [Sphingobium wenxiniae]|uniref:Enoyl reductase (ER) domain-containing protein n=1 Tax=Sphingobium wenxiniae (strain DSM 21828 / CGMCC 1.7748 / JZ-1) TaxID=595605 RepID=A0A562KEC9_SPHWJ|nr:NADP-dependent oxidoreductase [Sphingobium wenxiniae]MBB6191010.1 hypothetical protein [Sphingobium wenxiniae]TWH93684.1 hypothetical protein IQ35_01893 [Sphingobium wenxiniae]